MSEKNNLPFVSVVMPMYNEEKYIRKSLLSILNQDYPGDKYEVIIIDNNSNDSSADIVKEIQKNYNNIVLIVKEKRQTIPASSNEGIRKSRGEIIARLDCHVIAPVNYLSLTVSILNENKAELVSGIISPEGNNLRAKSMAVCLSSAFGIGDSRLYLYKEPVYTERGYLGVFRKSYVENFSLYDENLSAAEDYDLFFRIKNSNGRILVVPGLQMRYLCRESLKKIFKQYFKYGWSKIVVFKKYGKIISLRAVVPAFSLCVVLLLLLLCVCFGLPFVFFVIPVMIYLLINLAVSFRLSLKRSIKFIFSLPVNFIALHLSHALGFIYGFICKKYKKALLLSPKCF